MSAFFGIVGIAAADGAPVISSNTWAGQTLVATPVTSGDALEWFQCDSQGDNCVDTAVSGPDSPVIAAGSTYYVAESGTTTANSATTAAITQNAPSPSPGPSVAGTAQQGDTLSVTQGVWGPQQPDSITDTWERCSGGSCMAVSTASQYTLGAADVGDTLYVVETATYGPSQLTANSNSTAVVLPAPPANLSAPTISGSTRQGQTLTASPGGWSNSPTGYSYQWLQCTVGCSPIPGATGTTYRLTDADVGASVAVAVTAFNNGGASAADSARTGVVTATTSTGIVTSTSRARVNESVRLVAVVTSSADTADPDGTVTFYNGGAAISGCENQAASGSSQSVTVSCSASFAVSTPSISASFTPAAGEPLSGSGSSASVLTIIPNASGVTLDVPAEVQRGMPVTYTAAVTPADDLTGAVVPGGTIQFLDGRRAIRACRSVRMRDGGATCTTRYRATGSQRITAVYRGSPNFHGSRSRSKTVKIVRPVPRSRRTLGTITATMQWTFHYTPSYTRILALILHGVRAHSDVTLQCTGRGCPFHAHADKIGSDRATLDLEPRFRGKRLRVGSRLVVTVTRSRYVGKYYRFTVRSRRQPAVLISCLAPGSARPGVGCH